MQVIPQFPIERRLSAAGVRYFKVNRILRPRPHNNLPRPQFFRDRPHIADFLNVRLPRMNNKLSMPIGIARGISVIPNRRNHKTLPRRNSPAIKIRDFLPHIRWIIHRQRCRRNPSHVNRRLSHHINPIGISPIGPASHLPSDERLLQQQRRIEIICPAAPNNFPIRFPASAPTTGLALTLSVSNRNHSVAQRSWRRPPA